MYLAKLLLNPRSNQVRKDLARPYELHRTLMKAFPDKIAPDENRLLFRVETQQSPVSAPIVLAQSSSLEPDWNQLPKSYLLETPELKTFNPVLSKSQNLGFRLSANPTKKSEGKRIPLIQEQEYFSWIERKGNLHGFTVMACNAHTFRVGEGKDVVPSHERKTSLPLFGVRFDGFLQVDNPELLNQALASGIGSGKAFGFGLLSLART
ncbi:MAG: type I-E CRISPR-associated protein Cas6/Cse3/CasE [Candidatus Kapaibacterium sp.]